MKVQSKIIEGFRPIQITFTVETIDELNTLKRLFASNISVPKLVTGYDPYYKEDSKLMSQLMGKLHGALLIETDKDDTETN